MSVLTFCRPPRSCSYSSLKKHIFALEKQYHDHGLALRDLEASNERSHLMTADGLSKADKIFSGLLDKELQKIVLFYKEQEKELARDVENLQKDVAQKDTEGPSPTDSIYEDDEDDEDDDEEDGFGTKKREYA